MALLPGITETNFHKVALDKKEYSEPEGKSYPPEVVVKDALTALRERKNPTVISGPRYRILAAMATRLLSRKMRVKLMGDKSAGLK